MEGLCVRNAVAPVYIQMHIQYIYTCRCTYSIYAYTDAYTVYIHMQVHIQYICIYRCIYSIYTYTGTYTVYMHM